MTSGGNYFNDFPANQLIRFRANTAESLPVQTYISVCGNWTLRLQDTSPTGQFAYCLVISPTGHFVNVNFLRSLFF